MKIKIFSGSDASEIEKSVNEFIADKKVKNIVQSESMDGDCQSWSLTITVLYEEAGPSFEPYVIPT